MAVSEAGISTLGVKLGYAVEATAGTRPTAGYTWLERCNSIDAISLDTEQIDASALEDEVSRYVAGRQDTGGTWNVTFNVCNEVITLLETMMTAYEGLTGGKGMWFEVWSPKRTNGYFVKAQPPKVLPMPEESQNSLETIQLSFTIEDVEGFATGVEPA